MKYLRAMSVCFFWSQHNCLISNCYSFCLSSCVHIGKLHLGSMSPKTLTWIKLVRKVKISNIWRTNHVQRRIPYWIYQQLFGFVCVPASHSEEFSQIVFMTNLAISDCASPWHCPSVWSTILGAVSGIFQTGFADGVYFLFTSTCTQVYCFLTGLSVLRYIAVCHPVRNKSLVTVWRAEYHALRSGFLWPAHQYYSSWQGLHGGITRYVALNRGTPSHGIAYMAWTTWGFRLDSSFHSYNSHLLRMHHLQTHQWTNKE